MALEFARSNVISRSAGHTAVKAAAYRAGEKLHDQRIGRIANYSHRASEVGHAEILLPEGASSTMADRTTLWAAVEAREDQHNRRASARLAVDNIIALPIELSQQQHIELARSFAEQEYVSKGLVVDLAIHYHSEGNPHAHLMTTTRPLIGSEFGSKDREVAGKFFGGVKIADEVQLRHRWADFQNAYFVSKGIDASVRSNNGEFKAEVHLGPAHAMESKGIETARQERNSQTITARDQAILAHPGIIIDRVSDRKSLFTKHDLYRELNRLTQNPLVFSNVKPSLDNHASLIKFELKGNEFLTTQSVLEIEMHIRGQASKLAEDATKFAIQKDILKTALDRYSFLSEEQKEAAYSLGEGRRLGVVVGLAGAGKSTMLKALREGYEQQGFRVRGITLAGKASEELQQSAGIESRTIASWLLALKQGRESLSSNDIVTMDEAGMVNNNTMKNVLDEVQRAGSKLILIGDGEQLQPIQAGCPFRDIAIQEGFTEIATIRRQNYEWQRQATRHLATGEGNKALAAYEERGHVHRRPSASEIHRDLVNDYLRQEEGSKIILAHRNVDVRALNHVIRESLVESGAVEAGQPFRTALVVADEGITTPFDLRAGDYIRFGQTDKRLAIKAGQLGTYVKFENGQHHIRKSNGEEMLISNDRYAHIDHVEKPEAKEVILGVGDRILFTKNDKNLNVKNGTLGTVKSFKGGQLSVEIDVQDRIIHFGYDDYSSISHGYATTIHKSQGMTVDRSYLLGSGTMDKHLGYVAMSRHKESLNIYLSEETMVGRQFGSVISKAKRQETVLDLAEKQGLELDPAHPDSFKFTHIPISQEVAMDTAEAPNNPTLDLQSEMSPSASQEVAEASARRLLDRETRLGLSELQRRHEAKLAPLTKLAETTKTRLNAHLNVEPKGKGLFSSKDNVEKWQSNKRQLEIEHGNAKRAEVRAIDSYRAGAGERQYIAEERAKKKHPEAAMEVARTEARKQAVVLLDRWQSLSNQITQANDKGVEPSSSLRQSLDNVLTQIQQSALLKEVIPKARASSLEAVKAANKKQLEAERALEKGRGGVSR